MLLVLLGGILVAAAVAWYWAQIVYFLTHTVIPWVREKLGDECADLLTTFVKWLDAVVTPAARLLRKAYAWVKEKLVKLTSKYEQNEDSTVTKTAEQVTKVGGNKAVRVVTEEEIPWDELPDEVRETLIENTGRPVRVDEKREILKKADERADEDGLTLATAN